MVCIPILIFISDIDCFASLPLKKLTTISYAYVPRYIALATHVRPCHLKPPLPLDPGNIYNMCWNPDPDMRPSVDEVLNKLLGIEMELANAKWLNKIPEAVAYMAKLKAEQDEYFLRRLH